MKAIRLVLLICCAAWFAANPARADGWSWWPWGQSASPVKKASKSSPSVIDRATSGTRSFFRKTGNALTFKKKPQTVSQFPKWGSSTSTKKASSKSRSRRSEEPSWWDRMFAGDEPAPPRTAQEFLALPRPGDDF